MRQTCNEKLSSILLFCFIIVFFLTFSSSIEHTDTSQKNHKKKKQQRRVSSSEQEETQHYEKPLAGISPKKLGLKRDLSFSRIDLTRQVQIVASEYWFGTQTDIAGGKLVPSHPRDGGELKRLIKVRSFHLDVDCVTNEQFEDFVRYVHLINICNPVMLPCNI
jgi:hypothetical protein